MARHPEVSVLMAFYDDGSAEKRRYFREALQSVLSQSFRDFEIVLAVSGHRGFAEKEAAKHGKARFFYFRQPAIARCRPASERVRGIVEARNLCLRHAMGEFVAFADCDDISMPGRIAAQVDFLKRHPGIGAVGSSMALIDGEGKSIGLRRMFESDDGIRSRMLEFNTMAQTTACARSALVRKAGGYREGELSEDYDLWVRMAKLTGLHNLQAPLVEYRVHPHGSSKYMLEHYVSSLRVKWRAMRTLGLAPSPRCVAVNLMQLASVFLPDLLGKAAFERLRSSVAEFVYPELGGSPEKPAKPTGIQV